MTEEPKSFTVKDRRHFTADGQTREPEEAPPAEAEPASASPQGTPKPAGRPLQGSPEAPPGPGGGREAAVSFEQFLFSLGAQANMLLTGQLEGASPAEALGEARSVIGVLEMLKDKTEGRRTKDEDQVLEGLLYELRMAYVARAREVGE